jgi:hypothetical protein
MNFLSPDRPTSVCAKQSGDGVRTARASYEPSSSPITMFVIVALELEAED